MRAPRVKLIADVLIAAVCAVGSHNCNIVSCVGGTYEKYLSPRPPSTVESLVIALITTESDLPAYARSSQNLASFFSPLVFPSFLPFHFRCFVRFLFNRITGNVKGEKQYTAFELQNVRSLVEIVRESWDACSFIHLSFSLRVRNVCRSKGVR